MAIQISGTTVIDNSTNINVGAAGSFHVTGGDGFVKNNAVGLGQTDTTGRDAGIGTAKGTLIYNETTLQVEVYDGTGWIGGLSTPFIATGGTQDTTSRSGYTVHTFTSPGSFAVTSGAKTAEYLVIGGGGSGAYGGASSGGGGAGGYRTSTSFSVTPGTYTVQVGGGGAGAGPGAGSPGTPSFISNPGITAITSFGGGKSSDNFNNNAEVGGSGGGGAGGHGPSPGKPGINPSTPQSDLTPFGLTAPYPINQGGNGGNGFGNSDGSPPSGAGGGGAGGNGGNGAAGNGGAGGNGNASSITGTSVTRGGGGGGASRPGSGGAGGSGGGGAGGSSSQGTDGTANTGGGGGGSGRFPDVNGASGGSGIVIIAYPTS